MKVEKVNLTCQGERRQNSGEDTRQKPSTMHSTIPTSLTKWLEITRHFATALSRLLNALEAGYLRSAPDGAVLAIFQQASQARSVNKVNGLLVICQRAIVRLL
jgi:hypothetical protein